MIQNRTFNYDNRGFLLSETHPEKGPLGNGVVSYQNHHCDIFQLLSSEEPARKGDLLSKEPEILALVENLKGSLGKDSFQVVDRWEADLCAIGIASLFDDRLMVYVSTFDQSPGRYSFELEVPDEGADPPYRTVGAGDEIDYEELLRVIQEHLRPRPSP